MKPGTCSPLASSDLANPQRRRDFRNEIAERRGLEFPDLHLDGRAVLPRRGSTPDAGESLPLAGMAYSR